MTGTPVERTDVAQRVLWGWSSSRSALRRVPDTDAQPCSRTAPLSFRRRCRDFSCYLTLPGADGAAAWRSVGGLAVQVGARPDNVAVLAPDAAGRLTLQVNAWGSTTTALVGLDGTALATGGDRSTGDTLRWHMPHGSHAIVAHEGEWPFTGADIGSSILIPGAGHHGVPLRSTIIALAGAPNALFVADCAASFAKVSAAPLRWGGQLFVPADATAGVDLVLPESGLAARVAEYLGPSSVRLDRSGTLGTALRNIFVGRIALPRRALSVDVAADPSPDPRLHVYVKGTQLFVGWLTPATRGLVQAYRGPCLRYGGPFLPRITPLTDAPVRLRAMYCYVDDPIIEGQVLTDAEMWGMWNQHFAGPWDGNGVTHLTHRQFAAVDVPLLRAQDFSAT